MLKELNFDPIGIVTLSSFQAKWGTPRQGMLTPDSVVEVTLNHPISMVGRVAVIWSAHLNSASYNPLKARIKPPKKLDGTVGVFATRGVHRPSSIGLSFCTVIEITGKLMRLAGGDMILGTPVLAIIQADSLGMQHVSSPVRMPQWTRVISKKLIWSLGAFLTVQQLGVEQMITALLSQDPRSIHSIRKHVDPIYEVELNFGWVIYQHMGDDIVVLFVTKNRVVEKHRGRTEKWLERLGDMFPFLVNR